MSEQTAENDAPVSWCRVLRNGPPCPHLCVDCKTADALLTPDERARILRSEDE